MESTQNSFGNFIFSLIEEFYTKTLLPNSKPQSNEWTVISGIVLQHKNEYKMICFSNGTRALPNKNYINNKFQIFDSHSEILTLKCFKFFILKCLAFNIINHYAIREKSVEGLLTEKEFNSFNMNKEFYEIFDLNTKDKISLKENVFFHLYISAPPCGDCSVNKNLRFGSKCLQECIDFFKNDSTTQSPNVEPNKFRTKSIRSDYKKEILSFSLSCSDKLMLRNLLGIQGKGISTLINKIYLSSITINNTNEAISYEQCGNGVNPNKRNVLRNYRGKAECACVNIFMIKENILNNNIKQNERNSQPFSSFWYFPSTIQKIDPSTGLKCGSRIENKSNIDKFRATISKYDLYLNLLYLYQFCEEHKKQIHNKVITLNINKLQRRLLKVKNKQEDIHDVFESLTKDSHYSIMKRYIIESNDDVKEFKILKHNIIHNIN